MEFTRQISPLLNFTTAQDLNCDIGLVPIHMALKKALSRTILKNMKKTSFFLNGPIKRFFSADLCSCETPSQDLHKIIGVLRISHWFAEFTRIYDRVKAKKWMTNLRIRNRHCTLRLHLRNTINSLTVSQFQHLNCT